ncbi:MAG: hypothetical protein K2N63_03640 [Lachnospiraceae bacterium]|nr:hypothetical protein [Lachnospiraceae bacterium]
MKEQDEMKKNVDELKRIAQAPAARRKTLLTPKEWSVVAGILFAALAGLLTLSLDLIAVPEKDSTLWVLMALLYGLLILITVLVERFLVRKFQIHRTLYYVVVHILLLAAIIVLIVIGSRQPESVYEVSTEFSYAMAIGFTEVALLLYHLCRVVVLAILEHSKKDAGKKKR